MELTFGHVAQKPKMAIKSYRYYSTLPKCQKSTQLLILMRIDPLLAHFGKKKNFKRNLAY